MQYSRENLLTYIPFNVFTDVLMYDFHTVISIIKPEI